jgi:hypothetical protein
MALELLSSCPLKERSSRRGDVLRAVNTWSDERQRAGRPLAPAELDEVVAGVNELLWTGSIWRSQCVVRVGSHVHDSWRLRFH